MSIGNLKDEGNKGSNFPFQLKVLQGLQALVDNGACCDIIAAIDAKLRAQQRKPGVLVATGSGATTDGWYSFSIANVGSGDGVVDGVSIPTGTILNFDAGTLNNTLSSITYNATGTKFIITYIA